MMFKFILKILIILTFFTNVVRSEYFENVVINGNERISDETIIVFSELPSNKFLDENALNNILKKLFSSGFFNNVTVKIENNNLLINVKNLILKEMDLIPKNGNSVRMHTKSLHQCCTTGIRTRNRWNRKKNLQQKHKKPQMLH